MSSKPKILFVCGRNQWRSPTAYSIYKNDPRIEVRSAGVSSKSSHPISSSDIEWADMILIMEAKYQARVQGLFRDRRLPPIKSLEIPDEYEFMDEELIALIKSGAEYHIKLLTGK
ncbi:MAG TPA: hypothetical protein VLE49_14485 [Anaerolineales bacterium]|nr:hypothetical protein [Anaerolineales bacterium]